MGWKNGGIRTFVTLLVIVGLSVGLGVAEVFRERQKANKEG